MKHTEQKLETKNVEREMKNEKRGNMEPKT